MLANLFYQNASYPPNIIHYEHLKININKVTSSINPTCRLTFQIKGYLAFHYVIHQFQHILIKIKQKTKLDQNNQKPKERDRLKLKLEQKELT